RAADRASRRRGAPRRWRAWFSSTPARAVPAACPAAGSSSDRAPAAPAAAARRPRTWRAAVSSLRHSLAVRRLRRLVQLAHRHDAQHDTASGQVGVGHALHLSGGHGVRPIVVSAVVAWIAEKPGAVRELRRLAEIRLQTVDERQLLTGRRL